MVVAEFKLLMTPNVGPVAGGTSAMQAADRWNSIRKPLARVKTTVLSVLNCQDFDHFGQS